jgi:hypothetical protein
MPTRPSPTAAARAIGVATAAYGVSALLRPSTLARFTGFGDPASPDAAVRALSATIGVRDLVSGVAITASPAGAPLRALLIARAALDAGDAATFGALSRSPGSRRLIAAVALAWSALALTAARRMPPA